MYDRLHCFDQLHRQLLHYIFCCASLFQPPQLPLSSSIPSHLSDTKAMPSDQHASRLPLAIRQQILEHGREMEDLSSESFENRSVGHKFSVTVDWQDIFQELRPLFEDHERHIVPSVSKSIRLFINNFIELLSSRKPASAQPGAKQKDRYELGQKIKSDLGEEVIQLKVTMVDSPGVEDVEVSRRGSVVHLNLVARAWGEWDRNDEQINLDVLYADLVDDEAAERVPRTPDSVTEIQSMTPVSDGTEILSSNLLKHGDTPAATRLPRAEDLAEPEELLPVLLPYTLALRYRPIEEKGYMTVRVEGTHTPTIKLIRGYFERSGFGTIYPVSHSLFISPSCILCERLT